jgi:3-hydroxybutyryl-CoA dehydratase
MTLYLADIATGWVFKTAARTLAAADIDRFAALSGDHNRLHMDDQFARSKGYPGRIAHGMLTASIVTGLASPIDEMALLAYLETTRRFVAPVCAGDTIDAEYRVVDRRLSSKNPTQGVVTFEVTVRKSDGTVVQTGRDICMIENQHQTSRDPTG